MNDGILGVGATTGGERPDLSALAGALDEAVALGLDFVEIPLLGLDVIAGARPLKARVAAMRQACEARPLRYTIHAAIGLNFMDEPHRLASHYEVLRASLDVAGELGAVHVVVHTGICAAGQPVALDNRYARQREWLARAGDDARERGVTLCVENVWTFDTARYTASPSRLADEIGRIAHPNVCATLDVSHAYLSCAWEGVDFLSEIAALAPYAKHLHIHDSFGRPNDMWTCTVSEQIAFGLGDLHLPPGWGSIPWEAVMEAAVLPQGAILNLELQPRHWGEVAGAVASTRRLAGLARTTPYRDRSSSRDTTLAV